MKKILTKISALALSVLFITTSCSKFEEMNIDGNNPSKVPTSYLITYAERDLNYYINDSRGFAEYGTSYSQQICGITYTDVDRVELVESSWNGWYANGMANLQEVIRLNSDENTKDAAAASGSNADQIALANILLSWGFHNITDVWGDVPYTDALQGISNILPSYDKQEDIYKDLLVRLETAINTMDGGHVDGDHIYGGNMMMWKKFAGSLMMRIAIRMAHVDATYAKQYYDKGLTVAISSNDENTVYQQLGTAGNWNGFYDFESIQGRNDYAVSHTLINKMGALEDPRIHIYADPIVKLADAGVMADLNDNPDFRDKFYANAGGPWVVDGKEYAGQPYGYSNGTSQIIDFEHVSVVGRYFQDAKATEMIMSYSEVLFLQAEAATIWGGDASGLYEQAIAANMEYYGIEQSKIDAYLAKVPYVDVNSIHEEKWKALFNQGLEAWANWRRTGVPVLEKAPDSDAGAEIPRRRQYNETEKTLNKSSYDAGVASMGGDDISTRMWWDK